MAEDFKVQLSVKAGNDMLNIRASNASEFESLYAELEKLPALRRYFPATVAAVPASEPGGSSVATVAPAQEPAPLSPLELARQRMKGGK